MVECAGCGCVDLEMSKIHVTNGALTLCKQCLSDINRKNPATDRLRKMGLKLLSDWKWARTMIILRMPPGPLQAKSVEELEKEYNDAKKEWE